MDMSNIETFRSEKNNVDGVYNEGWWVLLSLTRFGRPMETVKCGASPYDIATNEALS